MTKEKHQCAEMHVADPSGFRFHQCSRNGKYFEDGKHWCKTHAPSQIKLRDEQRRQQWKEERDAGEARLRSKMLQALVKRVTLLHRQFGTDLVWLETEMPSPFPPEVDDTPLKLRFEVRKNHGKAYVVEHFPGIAIKELYDFDPEKP